ncbi:MAG: hypothetical protein M3R27_12940, partial [Bacteroidota bacterium]|nr:hypothetical protein [Bacteroidota bacterium]
MTEVLCCIFYVLLFAGLIWKVPFLNVQGSPRFYMPALFLFKVFVGIFIWQMYLNEYTKTDALAYFEESRVLYDLLHHDKALFLKVVTGMEELPGHAAAQMPHWNDSFNTFLINDSRTMIRLNAILRIPSFGFYFVHVIILSFVSFTGLLLLFKTFRPLIKLSIFLYLALFILPSVVFWSSSLLKESLLTGGIGLLVYSTQCGCRLKFSKRHILALLVGTIILLLVKIYILLIIVPLLFTNYWITLSGGRKPYLKFIISIVFIFLLLIIPRAIKAKYDPIQTIASKQETFIKMAKGGLYLQKEKTFIYVDFHQREKSLDQISDSTFRLKPDFLYPTFKVNLPDTLYIKGESDTSVYKMVYMTAPAGSAFPMVRMKNSISGLLKSTVPAFARVLFLPGLLKINRPFVSVAFAENCFLLLLFVLVLFFFKKPAQHPYFIFCT